MNSRQVVKDAIKKVEVRTEPSKSRKDRIDLIVCADLEAENQKADVAVTFRDIDPNQVSTLLRINPNDKSTWSTRKRIPKVLLNRFLDSQKFVK